MLLRATTAHLLTLSELFTNISAGFFGLVFVAPFPQIDFLTVFKNLIFGLVFYYLAARLKGATL